MQERIITMKKIIWLTLAVFLLYSGNVFANGKQEPGATDTLTESAEAPVIDGKVNAGEYAITFEMGKGELYLASRDGMLHFAYSARTTGWVAVGFKSLVMDDAHIIMGLVEDGKSMIMEQKGTGHSHRKIEETLLGDYMISEDGGVTVFEGEVDISSVAASDGKELHMIVACSLSDSVRSRHVERESFLVRL